MRILLIGHGYVGCYLRRALEAQGIEVIVCDEDASALAGMRNAMHCRYQDLTAEDLLRFDQILWFAGHSSVPKSLADPDGAVANNCLDLLQFARRKPAETRLIYASTASVYSVAPQAHFRGPPPQLDEEQTTLNPVNPYDCSKISFDALARCFADNVVGLRLGTVCGYSDRLRPELIFNAMNRSAMEQGAVRVANPNAARGILFLDDLAHYVLGLIATTGALPPILNTGSMNITIGGLGEAIARFHGVPVLPQPDARTYSFRMDCTRLRGLLGPPRDVSLDVRCEEFRAAYRPRALMAAS